VAKTVPAGVALALLLLAACGETATPAADDTGEGSGCSPWALRPQYLPWSGEGDPGPPDETRDASATWFAGTPGDSGAGYVTIEASDVALLDPNAAAATPTVRGSASVLVWAGDPGVGELALGWREADAACGHLTLRLGTGFIEPPAGTDGDAAIAAVEEEAIREIQRVADSLQG